MNPKLLLALALVGAVHAGEPAAPTKAMTISATSDKSYPPGDYGKVKDAPMFICWREWDGEIRLGGVAKSWSTPFMAGDSPAAENFFSVESSGSNGCTNKEHLLLFSDETTLLEFKQNYRGRIVVHNEPTVTKKPDGSWEITFAGKGADQPARAIDLIPVGTAPALEAASKIVPPAPLTVEWIGSPVVSDGDKYTPLTGWIKHREIGLRSDGRVVWRERK